jgi:hypothetical protein
MEKKEFWKCKRNSKKYKDLTDFPPLIWRRAEVPEAP